jgi:para-aminobenzoate synthetase component 1
MPDVGFIQRSELIREINRFSGQGSPFVFAVDFEGVHGFAFSPGDAAARGIIVEMDEGDRTSLNRWKKPGVFNFIPPDEKHYRAAFDSVRHYIGRGDTYLLNLTFQSALETDLDLLALFRCSQARSKLYVPGKFIVFSPEPFVTIADGIISSYPMKGTAKADSPDAEKLLLDNEKEQYEHNTIVDLIRNDLSMVATGVHVRRFRYVEKLNTNRGDLLQVSSEICGRLPEDYLQHLGDILFTMLPAGSVTGAPKEKTVQIIRETETYDRGFYTGIFGFFDGKTLKSAVSIRFIEETPSGLVFKSGGGITALSDPESEYRELLSKIYVPVI